MPRHGRGWAMRGGLRNENRHSPIAISLLEPALLVLLKEQPRHGYTLLFELDKLGVAQIHPSVVYRTLREMEEMQWIQSNWETDQTQGPPRRTYRLTAQGDETLNYWKQELERTNEIILQLLQKI